jgi:hypothetical protein
VSLRRRPDDPEILLEAATSAYRERDRDGRIRPAPAWADLAPQQRRQLFERQLQARLLEQATDPEGLSTTGRAVVDRIAGLPQFSGGP